MKPKVKNNSIKSLTLEAYKNGQLFLHVRRTNGKSRQYEDVSVSRTQRMLDIFYKWVESYYEDWSI